MLIRKSRGWKWSLYVVAFAQLISATGFSLVFPFLPFYVEFLGTHTHIGIEFWSGMVFSALGLTMMISSPLWGAVADRYGRKPMVVRAMLGGSFIMLLLSFARSAEEVVALRALQGMITGTAAATNAIVAALTPRERVGYAMGVMQTAFWVGISLGPVIGGAVSDIAGYRILFLIASALLFVGGTSVVFGVHEEFVPTETKGHGVFGFAWEWYEVIKTPGIAASFAVRFLGQGSKQLVLPFIPLFAKMLLAGHSNINTLTGLMMSLASAATVLTAIQMGKLGDRIGHKTVLSASLLLSALVYFPQGLSRTGVDLLVLQVLAGAAAGGFGSSLGALLARYSRVGQEGAVYGLDNSTVAASRAIAPMVGAAVASAMGIRWVFVAAGVVLLAGAITAASIMPKDSPPAT